MTDDLQVAILCHVTCSSHPTLPTQVVGFPRLPCARIQERTLDPDHLPRPSAHALPLYRPVRGLKGHEQNSRSAFHRSRSTLDPAACGRCVRAGELPASEPESNHAGTRNGTMTYVDDVMQKMQARLSEFSAGEITGADLLKEIRDQFTRSFKNGQRYCPKCNPKPPSREAGVEVQAEKQ